MYYRTAENYSVVTSALFFPTGVSSGTGNFKACANLYRSSATDIVYQKPAATLNKRFKELVAKWEEETQFSSSHSEMFLNENYLAIISLGPKVVPLLLKQLQDRPDHWFVALKTLTGENPIKRQHKGLVNEMVNDWITWGVSKGYIKLK